MKDILKTLVFGGLFLIPFLTLYVENDYFFPFITGKNFAFRIIVEIVFVLWALLALLDRRYRPKFSWVLVSMSALMIVMFFANLFGEHVSTGFFSNFERMDGYITLIHVYLLVLVLGSMFTEKRYWLYFMYTTLAVAFFVSFHGLAQFGGLIEGNRGRIDGQLGNAAYMAIYMLFHIFFAFWMFVESKTTLSRVLFALLAGMFIFTLINTGTRGTALGFLAGSTVMVAYIALFATQFREFRKYAIAAFVFIVVATGIFVAARDTEFVQSNGNLARIANISLSELSTRGTIWQMAFEGVKERPLLGWGQGNFNYVFNAQYEPRLYSQEQWFDRTHNIVLDWLIAGGVLGFLAYVSLFLACLYYLLWRPFKHNDETFTVLERAVLLGILAGYVTHNLVVFDNIISYIFFAVILGLIHQRVSVVFPRVDAVRIDEKVVAQFAAPVALVLLVAVIYTLHVPNMQAAGDIIDSYRSASPEDQLAAFERALSRDSFARQEIVEQFAQQAMNIARNQAVSEETRGKFVTRAEAELLAFVKEKPGDARVHVFLGTFYRSFNEVEKAAEQMAIARSLSPRKQAIIAQQGIVEFTRNNNEAARDFFKEAFDLAQDNAEAREYYAAALFFTGDAEGAKALVDNEATKERFAASDFLINGVNAAGDLPFLAELFTIRRDKNPENAQNWASLAFVYYQMNDIDRALQILTEGGEVVPSFKKPAECIADNIKNGRAPDTACAPS
ncbi:O-antigen ligase family protein [Patescibacteria group bacterium]|nr:O-antigen ligase family protein [Patescibacteria group bacterium]